MIRNLLETRTVAGAIARIGGATALAMVFLLSVPALAQHGGYPQLMTPPSEFELPGDYPRNDASAPRKLRVEAAAQSVMTDATTGSPRVYMNDEFGFRFSRAWPYHGRMHSR